MARRTRTTELTGGPESARRSDGLRCQSTEGHFRKHQHSARFGCEIGSGQGTGGGTSIEAQKTDDAVDEDDHHGNDADPADEDSTQKVEYRRRLLLL